MSFPHFFRALAVPVFAVMIGGVTPAMAQTAPLAEPPAPLPPANVVLPEPLAPAAAAFRDAMLAELTALSDKESAALQAFYGGRDWVPFWIDSAADRMPVLIAALRDGPAQGLPRYETAELVAIGATLGDPAVQARSEFAAMRAYFAYAGHLQAGVVAPMKVDPEIARRPARPGAAGLLAALADRPVAEALAGLVPADPDYARLVAEKTRLEGLVLGEAWGAAVPEGASLHPGESDPRVAAMRARLARMGYLAATGESVGEIYDPALATAVERFQGDHGLNADGVAGTRTIRAMNASPEDRLRQVLVNLERIRWLQRAPGERALRVNIPDFTVKLYDAGVPVWQTRAVVGELKTRTAEFDGTMTYMVVNPTWHIPDSIAIRTYLPKLQRDPQVLARQNIRLFTRAGTEINPSLVDFSQYTPDNFPFRIKQRPNDANALGQVKFMFPNQFSIYMHDTPHRELFVKDARAFSNGCIRLEKPVELAHILLTGQVPDPTAAFDAWRAAKVEKQVNLDRPIKVHIEYRSAFADETGAIRYRDDIYGRDAEVFRALEAEGVTIASAQG